MITNKSELKEYLEADRKALRINRKNVPFCGHEIWKFERSLRYYEYYRNRKYKSKLHVLCLIVPRYYWRFRYHRLSLLLGFHVPLNVCGKGLNIWHHGCVVISEKAKIGDYCCIQQCVNIGRNHELDDAPTIGNGVYIGPGAKLFGRIYIADNCAIGAGAVVTRSFEQPGVNIVGNPAHESGIRKPGLSTICDDI